MFWVAFFGAFVLIAAGLGVAARRTSGSMSLQYKVRFFSVIAVGVITTRALLVAAAQGRLAR